MENVLNGMVFLLFIISVEFLDAVSSRVETELYDRQTDRQTDRGRRAGRQTRPVETDIDRHVQTDGDKQTDHWSAQMVECTYR